MSWVRQTTPAVPRPLLPEAQRMPATWVPTGVVGDVAGAGAAEEAGAVDVAEGGGGIDPEVGGEVDVVGADAVVDDGDDDVGGVVQDVPAGDGLDVGARGAAGELEAGVAEAPLAGEAGIVRDDLGRHEIVGLDELIAAGGPEAGDGVGGGLVGREGDDAEVAEAGEAVADADVFPGLGGVDRCALAGEGFGEDDLVAEALGALLGGKFFRGRGRGGVGGECEQQGDGPSDTRGYDADESGAEVTHGKRG
jgi:hypothetical protein